MAYTTTTTCLCRFIFFAEALDNRIWNWCVGSVLVTLRGGHHLHTLFQYYRFDDTDAGRKSGDMDTVQSLQLENVLSCSTSKDRRLFAMFDKLVLADKPGIFQRRWFSMMVMDRMNTE